MPQLADLLQASRLNKGNMLAFVAGSTAGITTFEYGSGLIEDINELYEKIAPSGKQYCHDQAWGDANGYSHLRAALTGPDSARLLSRYPASNI